jgi:chromate transporter
VEIGGVSRPDRVTLLTTTHDDLLAAMQVAVAALIVRAVIRIGGHVVTDRWLWGVAIGATAAQLAGVHFGIILTVGGLFYLLARRQFQRLAWALAAVAGAGVVGYVLSMGGLAEFDVLSGSATAADTARRYGMPLPSLFWSGLKAGLLTFGGAYTVIPFLQRDAVTQGAWMSNTQFLDGLALSGLLPAPLIIFSTFVGYIGGGVAGAVAMTVGIFLPAFAFTLVGHDALERLVHQPRIRLFLQGVTAAVVGLITGTTLTLLHASLADLGSVVLFALALSVLFLSKARLLIPAVIAAAALWGLLSLTLAQ